MLRLVVFSGLCALVYGATVPLEMPTPVETPMKTPMTRDFGMTCILQCFNYTTAIPLNVTPANYTGIAMNVVARCATDCMKNVVQSIKDWTDSLTNWTDVTADWDTWKKSYMTYHLNLNKNYRNAVPVPVSIPENIGKRKRSPTIAEIKDAGRKCVIDCYNTILANPNPPVPIYGPCVSLCIDILVDTVDDKYKDRDNFWSLWGLGNLGNVLDWSNLKNMEGSANTAFMKRIPEPITVMTTPPTDELYIKFNNCLRECYNLHQTSPGFSEELGHCFEKCKQDAEQHMNEGQNVEFVGAMPLRSAQGMDYNNMYREQIAVHDELVKLQNMISSVGGQKNNVFPILANIFRPPNMMGHQGPGFINQLIQTVANLISQIITKQREVLQMLVGCSNCNQTTPGMPPNMPMMPVMTPNMPMMPTMMTPPSNNPSTPANPTTPASTTRPPTTTAPTTSAPTTSGPTTTTPAPVARIVPEMEPIPIEPTVTDELMPQIVPVRSETEMPV